MIWRSSCFIQFDLLLVVHWYHPLCVYILPSSHKIFNTQYIQNTLNIFVQCIEFGNNAYITIDIL